MRRFALCLLVISFIVCAPEAHADESETVTLHVHWVDQKPHDSVLLPGLALIAHEGDFELYRHGQPASSLLLEHVYLGTSSVRPDELVEALRLHQPEAVVEAFRSRPWRPPNGPFMMPSPYHHYARLEVDPLRHRFLSWFGTVHPADDAFLGNEDPMQVELFDADGRFQGPLSIDLLGNQVMDAGICYNDETRLMWLHEAPQWPRPGSCRASEAAVRHHPGLVGSQRNPEGIPGVLGQTADHGQPTFGSLYFDATAADFSQPGFRFGRLIITRGISGAASGSWYSPERSGEGFNFEILEAGEPDGPRRLLVHWFTYSGDGSGEQVWLSGIGPLESWDHVVVPMAITEGGRFASTDNPANVQRRLWGELEVRFLGDCSDQATVRFEPSEPGFESGEFTVLRLSPAIEGLAWPCQR